jgi:hypothetical protein
MATNSRRTPGQSKFTPPNPARPGTIANQPAPTSARPGAVAARPGLTDAPQRPREQGARPGLSPANTSAQVEQLAQQLANQIIRERDEATRRQRNGRIYTMFESEDVLPNNVETYTRGLFDSSRSGSLLSMVTSSLLTDTQKSYYQEVYDQNPVSDPLNAESQFVIAYGDFNGSGSRDLTGNLNNDTPSRAIYKQYAQVLLPPNDTKFTIGGVNTDRIYVLNFNRARFREKLDPGNLEIALAELSGSVFANINHTGSNVRVLPESQGGHLIQLVDDSLLEAASAGEAGLVYNIVSGTIDQGANVYNQSAPHYYGLMYPQYGIVILDANVLDRSASFNTVTGSAVQGDNAMKLFKSISGSQVEYGDNFTDRTLGIQARSSELVKSTYYFVRVKNAEYNYSNNPTFVSGSLGEFRYTSFQKDPQTYITTVGLYNDRRELLAVAKLSRPLLKAFTREALIKVKLDF